MAVAGFLGRYKGQSRVHAGSDLRVFLSWCAKQGLDPLDTSQVGRARVEAFLRWMQETRRYRARSRAGTPSRQPRTHPSDAARRLARTPRGPRRPRSRPGGALDGARELLQRLRPRAEHPHQLSTVDRALPGERDEARLSEHQRCRADVHSATRPKSAIS